MRALPLLFAVTLLLSCPTLAQEWQKLPGPPQGGQVNTKLVVDTKWRWAVIGYQLSAGDRALTYTVQDSFSVARLVWNGVRSGEVGNRFSDTLTSIAIDQPLNPRSGTGQRRMIIGGDFPSSINIATLSSAGGISSPPSTSSPLTDAAADSDSTWVATRDGQVCRIEDNGPDGTLTVIFTAPRGTRFTTITCPGLGASVYVGGYNGALFRSTNRGASFQAARTGIAATAHIREISFPNRDTGYAAASQGVYRTTDAAASWQLLAGTRAAKEVSFHDGRFGMYLADTGRRPVFVSRDGGLNWDAAPLLSRTSLRIGSLSVSREGHAFVLASVSDAVPRQFRDSVYYLRNPYPSLPTAALTRPSGMAAFHITPNPALGWADLTGIRADADWRLLSPTGQVLRQGCGPARLPLEGLASGLYLLVATEPNGTVSTARLVVE